MKKITMVITLIFSLLFLNSCSKKNSNPVESNNPITWAQFSSANFGCSVNALVVYGTNIFAGTNTGVFLSNNNGKTWTAIDTGLPSHTFVNALRFLWHQSVCWNCA